MAEATLRVKGLKETNRKFKAAGNGLDKKLRAVGKAAAEPVAAEARSRIGRYAGASVSTIKPRATNGGAFVRQNARKVTGLRGDFGALQMRILIGSLEDKRDEVERLYRDGIDELNSEAGF